MQTKFNLKIILISTTILAFPALAGDGKGDYRTWHDAYLDGHGMKGKEVSGGCGECNGPKQTTPVANKPVSGPGSGGGGCGHPRCSGGSGGGGASSGGKIVCTAMNTAYGFGSFRQAIWITYAAKNLTKYHETGYHLMAMPLIRIAYGSNSPTARVVRSCIEHMARERTGDIRAEMRGKPRRPLGRTYRAILEPLSYVIGRIAGGRTVEEIKDVPVIASQIKKINAPKEVSHV